MDTNKITVSWDELNSRKVDTRLREQQGVARTRSYSQLDAGAAPAPRIAPRAIWYNAFFYMAVFGLLGGILAWGGGELLLRLAPTDQEAAGKLIGDLQTLYLAHDEGKFSGAQIERAADLVRQMGKDNPWFVVQTEPGLTANQRQAGLDELARQDRLRLLIAEALAFGVCGVMIAVSLAIAEPLVQRNTSAAIVNGSVGALLGLIGGIVVAPVAMFWPNLLAMLPGHATSAHWVSITTDLVTWPLLGLFLAAAAGVVMRNGKKLLIGMAGGLCGGLLGGMLFEPIRAAGLGDMVSRLAALLAIGVVSALATALVENAAKSGWVRVLSGLIAGKQFILYRDPTYIGSSPECEIYLFKDPLVGPRHAAIHLLPGGFELENLPLGTDTLVNGKPIKRVRLRTGDRVVIGRSSFLFQEKRATPAPDRDAETARKLS